MSFTKEKREQIKKYILEKCGGADCAKKTAEVFGISLNTAYRYMRELEKDNIIQKKEKKYTLISDGELISLHRAAGDLVAEDQIYEKYIDKYICKFPENIQRIWQYSFMEMMNNAIDHSEAETVDLVISQNYLNTTIIIMDHGIGIFKKIKEYYNYDSLDDAVNELFKGKLTTDSKNHSGEGIFFTSRVLDGFIAVSSGKVFSHDKYTDEQADLKDAPIFESLKEKGTIIYMQLSNFSNKVLKEVFDMFSDEDGGFTKTRIPIKNIFETYPVSRSQAKRLCHRFEKFQEVELDFKEVSEIGQGFAHEIFVVFQNNHPSIKLVPINTSEEVSKMINHVKATV